MRRLAIANYGNFAPMATPSLLMITTVVPLPPPRRTFCSSARFPLLCLFTSHLTTPFPRLSINATLFSRASSSTSTCVVTRATSQQAVNNTNVATRQLNKKGMNRAPCVSALESPRQETVTATMTTTSSGSTSKGAKKWKRVVVEMNKNEDVD